MTHLIHRSKIQSIKVLQSQKRWQNKSVGEPVKQLSFLCRKVEAYSSSCKKYLGKLILFNCFFFLYFSNCTLKKCSPVLDVSLPAAKPRSVHGQGNCIETSPFSSSYKLCNHIPVFIHLKNNQRKQF